MPISHRIRLRRQELKLTQTELASRMRAYDTAWDVTTVSKAERGIRRVDADEVPYLAAALECDVSDLLDLPPKPSST